jgi:hypothetical protein
MFGDIEMETLKRRTKMEKEKPRIFERAMTEENNE